MCSLKSSPVFPVLAAVRQLGTTSQLSLPSSRLLSLPIYPNSGQQESVWKNDEALPWRGVV